MKFTSAVLSGVVGAGTVAGALAFAGAASAAPGDCTAAQFAHTVSSVSSQTATYLDNHPDVNNGVTNAAKGAAEGQKREAIKTYFDGNPAAKADLEKIRQPMKDLKNRCGDDTSAADDSAAPAQPAGLLSPAESATPAEESQPAAWNPFAPAAPAEPADEAAPAASAKTGAPAGPAAPAAQQNT